MSAWPTCPRKVCSTPSSTRTPSTSWDEPIDIAAPDPTYQTSLRAAAERAGTDESVLTGRGLMRRAPRGRDRQRVRVPGRLDRPGRCAADRVGRPARDQPRASRCSPPRPPAARACRRARRPSCRWSTSRGRSWTTGRRACRTSSICATRPPAASSRRGDRSAHITVAEPGALIGFLGPKVFELLEGRPFPPGVQVAENLADRGIIDAVVLADELPSAGRPRPRPADRPAVGTTRERRTGEVTRRRTAWESIEITRSRRSCRRARSAPVRQRRHRASAGHREGRARQRDDRGVRPARRHAVRRGRPGPHHPDDGQPDGPAALREARRGHAAGQRARPAARLVHRHPRRRPVARGRAGRDGRRDRPVHLARWRRCPCPPCRCCSVRVAAAARWRCSRPDVVIAAENAWLSPLPPEGASAIVHGDVDHAAEMAEQQRVSALDLFEDGTVHHLVAEPEDDTPEAARSRDGRRGRGARLRDLA